MPMNISSYSYLSSKTVEVKSRDISFFVNSKLLAKWRLLPSAITGAELEEKIELLEWDGNTVARFIDFLYHETYEISPPEEGVEEKETKNGVVPSDPEQLGEMLKAHPKVYTLAQHKRIEALRMMALERLKEVLKAIDGSLLNKDPKLLRYIIEMLDYVYFPTCPSTDCDVDTQKRSNDPMRDVVSTFAAAHFEKLKGHGEIRVLMGKGGDFAVDLMEKVAARLCNAGGELVEVKSGMQKLMNEVERKLQKSEENNTEITQDLNAAERRLEAAKKREEKLTDKVRESNEASLRLEAAKRSEALKLREISKLNDKVANMERLLEEERAKKSTIPPPVRHRRDDISISGPKKHPWDNLDKLIFFISGWNLSLRTLLSIATTTLFVIGMIVLSSHKAAYAPSVQAFSQSQSQTIDGKFFRNLCQYYEAYNWAGSDFVRVEGKSLKVACNEHSRGSRVLRPVISTGRRGDICKFYEQRLWAGSYYLELEGKSLELYCQDTSYTPSCPRLRVLDRLEGA
ncbi:hypothetical protein DFP73DRAFT_559044 [Morchella snyderi]|nr:hypothetical protein DFP73DRAFT_559044 [Morchella snyderi]